MIHATLTDGRTVLFEEDERIQTSVQDPRTHGGWSDLYYGWASDLPGLSAHRGRYVRANRRGRWWHIRTARRVPDVCVTQETNKTQGGTE